MHNYFTWNGVRSTDYGVVMLSAPTRITPIERISYVEIPGRSGSLTMQEGDDIYEDINLACTCIIDKPDRIDEIVAWLKGSGEVAFNDVNGNEPDGFYKGRIVNQISFSSIVRMDPHRSFELQFRCKPYFYYNSGLVAQNYTDSAPLINPGNVASEPIITLYGSSQGTIMIGRSTMLINSFSGIDYITLDCESKVAYQGAPGDPNDPLILLGTRVTGEWAKIPIGTSFIQISGGITNAVVMPRWRRI